MALIINSWSFDQPSYTTGQTITLTVNYTPDTTGGTVTTVSDVTVTVSDASNTATQASDPTNGGFPQFTVDSGTPETAEPTTVTVTDDRATPGTWTLVSNTLSDAAPFTGVAVLTSVA
jgi:hypothetical protein